MYLFRRMTYILPLTYQLLTVVACNCVSLKRHLHPVAPRASAACHSRLYISREDHLQAVVPHVSATYYSRLSISRAGLLTSCSTSRVSYLLQQLVVPLEKDHLQPAVPHTSDTCHSRLYISRSLTSCSTSRVSCLL